VLKNAYLALRRRIFLDSDGSVRLVEIGTVCQGLRSRVQERIRTFALEPLATSMFGITDVPVSVFTASAKETGILVHRQIQQQFVTRHAALNIFGDRLERIRTADNFVASDIVVGVLEALQLRCLAVEFALFDETAAAAVAGDRLVVVTKLDLICETASRNVVVCEIKIRPTVSTAQSWNDQAALLQLACGGFLLTRATRLPVRHLLLVEVFRECVDTQLRDEILLTSFTLGPSWAQAVESVLPCTEGWNSFVAQLEPLSLRDRSDAVLLAVDAAVRLDERRVRTSVPLRAFLQRHREQKQEQEPGSTVHQPPVVVSASSATNRAAVLVAATLRDHPSEERAALLAQQLEAFSLTRTPSEPAPGAPPTPSRRPRLAWSEEETSALLEGVKVFGTGKWEQVLASFAHRFQPRRSAEDLRSRYRTISRAAAGGPDNEPASM
jgi:hypothetical protein